MSCCRAGGPHGGGECAGASHDEEAGRQAVAGLHANLTRMPGRRPVESTYDVSW